MADRIGEYSAALANLEQVAHGFASRFIREGFSSEAWESIKHPKGGMDRDLSTLAEACLDAHRAKLAWERQNLESSESHLAETYEALGWEDDANTLQD